MSEEQLTTEQRQELYTLMGQWSRNTDLQFQQVAEWADKQLAQVCEQRDADRDDELVAAALGDSLTDLAEQGQDLDLAEHWQRRAEAAELALQTAKKELAENEAMDDGNFRAFKLLEERNAELLLALQAKEQELGRVTELCVEYGIVDVHGGIDTDTLKHTLEGHARWKKDVVKQSVEIERLKRELAQARQQAIAEGMLFQFLRMKKERPVDPIYWDAHEEKNLRETVRSLTPIPALTKEK